MIKNTKKSHPNPIMSESIMQTLRLLGRLLLIYTILQLVATCVVQVGGSAVDKIVLAHAYCQSENSSESNPTVTTNAAECGEYWKAYTHGNNTAMYENGMGWMKPGLFNGSSINDVRLQRMMRKLQRGESVKVFVFGGSLTAGRWVKGVAGAWPAEVTYQWSLAQNRKEVKGAIVTENYAVGGTSTSWLVEHLSNYFHSVGKGQVDLVILDYDVNDCLTHLQDNDKSRADLISDIEVLLRRLLQLKSEPAIVYFATAISSTGGALRATCADYHTCYQIGEVKRPIMDYYDIPVVSQKLSVWPRFDCPPGWNIWDCASNSCAHPKWLGHETMAMVMFTYLKQLYSNVVGSIEDVSTLRLDSSSHAAQDYIKSVPFLEEESSRKDQLVCSDHRTIIDKFISPVIRDEYDLVYLNQSNSSVASVGMQTLERPSNISEQAWYNYARVVEKHSCWEWKEDMAGKEPGWISDGPNCLGTNITFQLRFGSLAHLMVSALHTWNHTAGMVHIEISEPLVCADDVTRSSSVTPCHAGSATGSLKYFSLGVIDMFREDGDNGLGYSTSEATYFVNVPAIVASAVQNVRFTIVDSNEKRWRDQREWKYDRDNNRENPQKVKLLAMFTC